jgi:predicted metal-dependent enzyme (double-stranded beta helix superfamily)
MRCAGQMDMDISGLARLRRFVCDLTRLVDQGAAEPEILDRAGRLLGELVSSDDWLPEEFAEPDPAQYRQYLLYCDPLERFSVVSFVWGVGQKTPVHDHTVWGLIGMLRGAEVSHDYRMNEAGKLEQERVQRLEPGMVAAVSPAIGDIHRVENALTNRASISIHAYGANIGAVARHVFLLDSGEARPFVSGYANRLTPNLWDRSAETRHRLGLA